MNRRTPKNKVKNNRSNRSISVSVIQLIMTGSETYVYNYGHLIEK